MYEIQEVIRISIKSGNKELDHQEVKNCWKIFKNIFGLDFREYLAE
jgi:hypothetical protein